MACGISGKLNRLYEGPARDPSEVALLWPGGCVYSRDAALLYTLAKEIDGTFAIPVDSIRRTGMELRDGNVFRGDRRIGRAKVTELSGNQVVRIEDFKPHAVEDAWINKLTGHDGQERSAPLLAELLPGNYEVDGTQNHPSVGWPLKEHHKVLTFHAKPGRVYAPFGVYDHTSSGLDWRIYDITEASGDPILKYTSDLMWRRDDTFAVDGAYVRARAEKARR